MEVLVYATDLPADECVAGRVNAAVLEEEAVLAAEELLADGIGEEEGERRFLLYLGREEHFFIAGLCRRLRV